MSQISNFFVSALDPRGRCNRRGLFRISRGIAAIELALLAAAWCTGAGLDGPAITLLKVFCVWVTFASASKRMHDLGLSAWRLLAGVAALLAWLLLLTTVLTIVGGPAAVDPESPQLKYAVAGVVLPVLATIIWLHFAPGQAEANIYGPAPSAAGAALSPLQARLVERLKPLAGALRWPVLEARRVH